MAKEEIIRIRYQYLANKKNYLFGLRVKHLKLVLIGVMVSAAFLGVGLTIIVLLCWLSVGYWIDLKQRKESRNYVQGKRTWMKTKSILISDTSTGVLSVFKNGNRFK